MTGKYRFLIQVGATTIVLVLLAFVPTAFAGSGDPMSRDVEFKEGLAKHNETGGSVIPGAAYRLFPRRTYSAKRTSP